MCPPGPDRIINNKVKDPISSAPILPEEPPPPWQQELDLSPLYPLDPAHRIRRRYIPPSSHEKAVYYYEEEQGEGEEDKRPEEAPTRRVLERLGPSPTTTTTTTTWAYTIDGIIIRQPNTGVTILLATPMMPQDKDDASSPLVSCGGPVVIKAVPRSTSKWSSRRGAADDPLKEIGAMHHLQSHDHHSPHVICLLDCLQDKDFYYLILPYLSGGDLFSRVEATDGKGLSDGDAANYLRQIIEGLLFMKETSGIAHHDISLENVMLTDRHSDVAQIIDLGMCLRTPTIAQSSKEHDQSMMCLLSPQRCRGKPAYVAPEVVREEACDPYASDIWSLGVCLYAMLVARPLYTAPADRSFKLLARGLVREVVDSYEMYGLHLSPCAKDLVCRMLHADPTKRPTLEEVLHHPFMTQNTASTTPQPNECPC